MKHSLSFHATMLILKIKGIKKMFSSDPVDYKKVRKEDVHAPKGRFYSKQNVRTFKIDDTSVKEIKQEGDSKKLLIFVHGGAFISGPAQHHWDRLKELFERTEYTLWMCNYPKAPENKIETISSNMDAVYNAALEEYAAAQISMIGDSVGGTLIASLVQRVIQKDGGIPHQLFLISPVMDATLSNADIEKVDPTDPMLSKVGILSSKRMCAGDIDLNNPMISPLYGSFERFPKTVMYLAENDITYPDQQLTIQKMVDANVIIEAVEGKGMPHIWPFLPVMKEAKSAFNKIVEQLNR